MAAFDADAAGDVAGEGVDFFVEAAFDGVEVAVAG